MLVRALERGLQFFVHLRESGGSLLERLVLDELQPGQQSRGVARFRLVAHTHEYSSAGTRSP